MAFNEKDITAPGTVFLDTISGDRENSKSLLFTDPVQVIKTFRVSDVFVCLEQIDSLVKQGFYAAGYLAFEAGYALEDKIKPLLPEKHEAPLVWFGIYRSCEEYRPGEIPFTQTSDAVPVPARPSGLMRKDTYLDAIKTIRDLIASGEVYQINYTWTAKVFCDSPLRDLYCSLRSAQAVPYGALINTGERTILSLSPELFFRRKGKEMITRPMKGTIERGKTGDADLRMREQLRASEKDRAENLMIVDLLRNDLYRVCEPDSVSVPELFSIEQYETLHQMTSTVKGTLKQDTCYADIFRALFPCGSVTGAPKVRAMEIIRDMECADRGIYTGSIGYIAPADEAVFNVAIRTLVFDSQGGTMGIGSGIVWDSDPEDEYNECLLKMSFLSGNQKFHSLIESLLLEDGSFPLIQYHMNRMERSAARFGYLFKRDEAAAALEGYALKLDIEKAYKVRLVCDPRGDLVVEHEILPQENTGPGRIILSEHRTDSDDFFLYHKTTNRDTYNRIFAQGRDRGYSDVIFCNTRREITEGCISNIFIEKNGELLTPPVGCGLLPGVMRKHILRTRDNAREQVLFPEDLTRADAVYICNAVRGLRKVVLDPGIL